MAAAVQMRDVEVRRQIAERRANTAPKRLEAADEALQEGDIDLACVLYTRLAVSRPRSAVTEQAKRQVAQLQEQARQELSEIDAMLTGGVSATSPTEVLRPVASGSQSPEQVVKAFQEYDRLAYKYRRLPVVGFEKGEIAKHVAKQQRGYASVLNELKAKTLWELGQKYEADGHACCAYNVYEEAAELVPAPSAQLAQARLAKMKEDPQIVASAETCREVQWCLAAYLRAEEQVAKKRPDRARAILGQIVQRAPDDTRVYQDALARIEELK